MFFSIEKTTPTGFPGCILTVGFSSLQQYFELRSRQIQKLRETQSPNPYPHKFEPSISLTEYVELYGFNEEEVKAAEEKEVAKSKKNKVPDELLPKAVEGVRARHIIIKPGEKLEGTVQALAGRIHNVRASGQKLRFYDLHGEGTKVQIMATLQYVDTFVSVFNLRLTFPS